MDLTTASPVEFDTALASRYADLYKAQDATARAWETTVHYVNDYLGKLGYRVVKATDAEIADALAECVEIRIGHKIRQVVGAFDTYEHHQATVDEIGLEIAEFNDVFRARGGWTRAFLVDNSNGHVHSSMACGTCFPTTRFSWITEMSDHDETEIVEKAGERACTVCYPSAPVEVLSRPTQFFTPDEKAKQQAKIEREAKRAEKAAAEITVEGIQDEWTNQGGGKHTYKTTRAATNAIAGWLNSIAGWSNGHPSQSHWEHNIKVVRAALEAKGIEYDFAKAQAAAEKKARR